MKLFFQDGKLWEKTTEMLWSIKTVEEISGDTKISSFSEGNC